MTELESSDRPLTIVYDGDCPFCNNYVRFMALREKVGDIELIDARSDEPVVRDLWKSGYDLNEGMAAIHGGIVYYGSDAMSLISTIEGNGGLFKRVMSRMFRNPARARALYPFLKTGRRVTLRLMGKEDLAPTFN